MMLTPRRRCQAVRPVPSKTMGMPTTHHFVIDFGQKLARARTSNGYVLIERRMQAESTRLLLKLDDATV
jgi:hypothetical protein